MKPKKQSKNYFTQETEDAIVKYNLTEDPTEKSKIYEDKIHYAFFKLTENIIHTFKFYHTEVEELTDLQHEIIIFLLSKIHFYHPVKNLQERLEKIIIKEFGEKYNGDFCKYIGDTVVVTQPQINEFIKVLNVVSPLSPACLEKLKKLTPPKAYSYFGTITKRWLIIYTQKNYKKKLIKTPLESIEQDNEFSCSIEDKSLDADKLSMFMDLWIKYCLDNIYILFPAEIDKITQEENFEDAKVADAILELFKKRGNLDIFNKKALYMNIRERIEVKTSKITQIADELYEIFRKSYINYLEYGFIKF